MGHAELAAPFLAIGVDVDADDLVGADHPGALDDVESDPAETEDDDRLARLNICGVDHRADPGGDAAADVAARLERRVLTDFRDSDFGQPGEVGEGRTAHLVENRPPLVN